MRLQEPGELNYITLSDNCGIDVVFEASHNRRLHVPPQKAPIEVVMPGVPFDFNNIDGKLTNFRHMAACRWLLSSHVSPIAPF